MDTVAQAWGGKASLGLHYVVPTWGRLQVGEAPGGAGSGAVMSPGGSWGIISGQLEWQWKNTDSRFQTPKVG